MGTHTKSMGEKNQSPREENGLVLTGIRENVVPAQSVSLLPCISAALVKKKKRVQRKGIKFSIKNI